MREIKAKLCYDASKMKLDKRVKIALVVIGVLLFIYLLVLLSSQGTLQVLTPKGSIAESQRDLIVVATILMLIIVLPVLLLTFFIAWRYREGNTKATYSPNLHGSKLAESLWWGLPLVIITILSVIIWKSSHELDPYRPIDSQVAPLKVQVIALQWKWLFLYPDQNVATVNYLKIPIDTPINFEITSDAPMNSFWIPQLGGQVYAMSGMTTKLHLSATQPGVYQGSSANLSGEGFSGMRFEAQAVDKTTFDQWAGATKAIPLDLNTQSYGSLSQASKNNPHASYGSFVPDLYDTVVMKYMSHGSVHDDSHQEDKTDDH